MRNKNELTPGVLVAKIRENLNNNKTFKAMFNTHFLGKFSNEELAGMQTSINKELKKRQQTVIDEKIEYLKSMGYSVSK